MPVSLKGYYDASGSRGAITLGGYAATQAVWDVFEPEWWRVLADDRVRPCCSYLHMREAKALRGEFSAEHGWTKERVAFRTQTGGVCGSSGGGLFGVAHES